MRWWNPPQLRGVKECLHGEDSFGFVLWVASIVENSTASLSRIQNEEEHLMSVFTSSVSVWKGRHILWLNKCCVSILCTTGLCKRRLVDWKSHGGSPASLPVRFPEHVAGCGLPKYQAPLYFFHPYLSSVQGKQRNSQHCVHCLE